MKYQFKNVRGLKKARPEDIIKVEADVNYSIFYLKNGKNFILAKTLKQCEGIFEPFSFYRTHRSCIVNLDYCQNVTSSEVILKYNLRASISRRRLSGLLSLLENSQTKSK